MTVDLRLALPAASAWLAAWLLVAAGGFTGWIVFALWALAATAVGVVALRRERRVSAGRGWSLAALITVCAAGAALVGSAVAVNAPARAPAELVDLTHARQADATIRVDTVPVAASSSGRFGAALSRVQFGGTMTSAQVGGSEFSCASPVFVSVPSSRAARLEIGSTIVVTGKLMATPPGEQSAFLVFGNDSPRAIAPAPWYLDWANTLRREFAAASTALAGDGGDLLPGLAIGDTSAVSAGLDTAMKTSSLSHLTAVSGANCAVIIAAVMLLGAALGLRRGVRIALSVAVLVGFVVLVTPGPSVLRAAVMASVVIFSLAAGRPGRGVPALSLAVIVLLVADPWLARSYGFALSVLATAGILVLSGPLARVLSRWLPRSIATLVSIPLAAQIACQPVLVLLNPAIPLYGVAANLLAEPAAPIATVLGLIACLLLPWAHGIGVAVTQLAWVPSAWIASVARVTSELPGSQLPWLPGIVGLLLVAALLATVLVIVLRRGGRHRWLRVTAIALVLVACGGYAGGMLGAGIGRAAAIPADWQIGACDIGQGDAGLVRSGDAHALIDVGPDPKPLAKCLHELGIDRIDLLVLTHYDLDHVGGLSAVIGRVDVALVGAPDGPRDEALFTKLRDGGATVRHAADGDHGTLGRLDWQVVWPNRDSTLMQTGNEGSVTIEFSGAGIRSIFLGDLDERAQSALLATNRVGTADVVKVAHHGSADQSERLYRHLRARLGMISVGLQNDYGHPTAKLLGILTRTGTMALRTDLEGMILIGVGTEGSMSVWTEKRPPASATSVPATG